MSGKDSISKQSKTKAESVDDNDGSISMVYEPRKTRSGVERKVRDEVRDSSESDSSSSNDTSEEKTQGKSKIKRRLRPQTQKQTIKNPNSLIGHNDSDFESDSNNNDNQGTSKRKSADVIEVEDSNEEEEEEEEDGDEKMNGNKKNETKANSKSSKPDKKDATKKKDDNGNDDDGEPKKPLSALRLYIKEERAKFRKEMAAKGLILKSEEVVQQMSEKWKTLSTEFKKKYEDITKQAQAEYKEKMEIYKAKHGLMDIVSTSQTKSKSKETKENEDYVFKDKMKGVRGVKTQTGLILSQIPRGENEPAFIDLAREALTQLNDKTGCQLLNIASWIGAKYNLEGKQFENNLKNALKSATDSNILIRNGTRYLLNKEFEKEVEDKFKSLKRKKEFSEAGASSSTAASKSKNKDDKGSRATKSEDTVPLEFKKSKKPALHDCLPLSYDDLTNLLAIGEFCVSFSNDIKLSPFTLDTLYYTLHSKEKTTLLDEIHIALLKTLAKSKLKSSDRDSSDDESTNYDDDDDDSNEFGDGARTGMKKSVLSKAETYQDGNYHLLLNSLNWQEVLRRYILETCKQYSALDLEKIGEVDVEQENHARMYELLQKSIVELSMKPYVELDISCKIACLKALVEDLIRHPLISDSMDGNLTRLDDLRRLRNKSVFKDAADTRKIRDMEKLKQEREERKAQNSNEKEKSNNSKKNKSTAEAKQDDDFASASDDNSSIAQQNESKRNDDNASDNESQDTKKKNNTSNNNEPAPKKLVFSEESKAKLAVIKERKNIRENIVNRHEVALRVRVSSWGKDRSGNEYFTFACDRSRLYVLTQNSSLEWKCYKYQKEYDSVYFDCEQTHPDEEILSQNLLKYKSFIVSGLEEPANRRVRPSSLSLSQENEKDSTSSIPIDDKEMTEDELLEERIKAKKKLLEEQHVLLYSPKSKKKLKRDDPDAILTSADHDAFLDELDNMELLERSKQPEKVFKEYFNKEGSSKEKDITLSKAKELKDLVPDLRKLYASMSEIIRKKFRRDLGNDIDRLNDQLNSSSNDYQDAFRKVMMNLEEYAAPFSMYQKPGKNVSEKESKTNDDEDDDQETTKESKMKDDPPSKKQKEQEEEEDDEKDIELGDIPPFASLVVKKPQFDFSGKDLVSKQIIIWDEKKSKLTKGVVKSLRESSMQDDSSVNFVVQYEGSEEKIESFYSVLEGYYLLKLQESLDANNIIHHCEVTLLKEDEREAKEMTLWPYKSSKTSRIEWRQLSKIAQTDSALSYLYHVLSMQWYNNVEKMWRVAEQKKQEGDRKVSHKSGRDIITKSTNHTTASSSQNQKNVQQQGSKSTRTAAAAAHALRTSYRPTRATRVGNVNYKDDTSSEMSFDASNSEPDNGSSTESETESEMSLEVDDGYFETNKRKKKSSEDMKSSKRQKTNNPKKEGKRRGSDADDDNSTMNDFDEKSRSVATNTDDENGTSDNDFDANDFKGTGKLVWIRMKGGQLWPAEVVVKGNDDALNEKVSRTMKTVKFFALGGDPRRAIKTIRTMAIAQDFVPGTTYPVKIPPKRSSRSSKNDDKSEDKGIERAIELAENRYFEAIQSKDS